MIAIPFTPFHAGPGLLFGLLLRRHVHPVTFLIANLIIDLEPLVMVFILGLNYPLHGYIHTFLGAGIVGVLLGYTMHAINKYLEHVYRIFLGKIEYTISLKGFILAGVTGTILHVLLDSPLYPDIKPFYPLQQNPLYNPQLLVYDYMLCIITGILGIILYICLILRKH